LPIMMSCSLSWLGGHLVCFQFWWELLDLTHAMKYLFLSMFSLNLLGLL
jgi:hypothetical protein